MKITPLEIRQKTFEKAFRGLDKDEVQAYLTSLSQEWERIQDENKELRIKLEAAEKEVGKLREVESSLFKTLKTAEDTGVNMISQAEKTAQLHLKESQMNADAILNDAQNKARNTIEEADMQARDAIDEMEEQLKSLAQAYRTLESFREDLLSGLKAMANEVLEKSSRVSTNIKPFDVDEEIHKAKSLAQNYKFKNGTKKNTNNIQEKPVEQPPVAQEQAASSTKESSFFDDIE
ncbi:MAG: DivIVA domain-containing protein [Cyclobacteriaceae bacterium]|nr:DivIVA domain-containing protein [Cyclobacteriaceae bacterium]